MDNIEPMDMFYQDARRIIETARSNAVLYERLLISNDKESVLAVARKQRIPENPTEVIKEPMMLEFLGLPPKLSYSAGSCHRRRNLLPNTDLGLWRL